MNTEIKHMEASLNLDGACDRIKQALVLQAMRALYKEYKKCPGEILNFEFEGLELTDVYHEESGLTMKYYEVNNRGNVSLKWRPK